jgi:2-polyprenyl-6-methoxyphenol hydroxylase-like FAD-dependent oxidoreductase
MANGQTNKNKSTTSPMLGEHAIVIGGSIAGLLTARVLSDYFERVTIFEADTPPDEAVPRKGVPQGNHIHTLAAGGSDVVRKFFPDIHDDLVAAGAEYGDPMLNWRRYIGAHWGPRIESGLGAYVSSRPLLEAMVRKHTVAIANVELRVATPVSGYTHSTREAHGAGSTNNDSNIVVTGVTLEQSGETVAADFVADVSGRNSKASSWIEPMGFTPPQRSTVGVDVGYTTFEVAEPQNNQRDWSLLFVSAKDIPKDTRYGGILHQEGGRYLVTAQGFHKDYPPTDWPGFLAYMKALSFSSIYDELKDLQPMGEAKIYRFAAYLRRHYERLQDFPQRLVVVGDALCSFNPVYAQGMTVAAKEVEHLDACLRQCLEGGGLNKGLDNGSLDKVAQPFFKGASKFIDAAWDSTTVEDFRYPQTRGERPRGYGLVKWLNRKFFALSATDEEFSVAFIKVYSLVEPPESLLKPKYLFKALFAKMPEHDREPPFRPVE